MKLLTRKEIIKIWSKQSEVLQNSYCCPNCKNLLYYDIINKTYSCINPNCLNNEIYEESNIE